MNLSSKLTVLVLTYNRYDRLLRLLKYLDSCHPSFTTYILDSSSDPFDAIPFQPYVARNPIQHFRFDPSLQPLRKIGEALKKVATPYTVIWADDDFMVPRTFEIGVEFLDQHRDFSFVHGQSGLFNLTGGNGGWARDAFSYYPQRDILGETAQERLCSHLNQYTCIFYSIYRTEILRKGIETGVDYPFSYNFDEIVPSCVAVIHGKGKKLNQLYMLRERHEKAGLSWRENMGTDRKANFFDWATSPVFAKDSNKMIQVLADEISKIDRISFEEARGVATQAFWKYLANGLNKKWKDQYGPQTKWRAQLRKIKTLHSLWMCLRSLSRREEDRFLLPALKRKSSPYHRDFQAVYQCLIQK